MAHLTTIVNIVPSPQRAPRSVPPLVVALAYDRICTFELGIVVEIFGLRRPQFERWYDFLVCAADRGPLRATGGFSLQVTAGLEQLSKAHTIIIPGWRNVDERPSEDLVRALRTAHRRGTRLVSICSGVFALAATGLLDGRRATTHWRLTDALARQYPKIKIHSDVLYVDEGDILTSAGSAAGIDLGLHIVRRDFGARIANEIGRQLVMSPHREGGQAQFVPRPVSEESEPWLSSLLEWAQKRLHEPLSIERLAKQAQVSKRTLARRFAESTGNSPAQWVINLRIAGAKDLLETTNRSIERVAHDVGFGSAAVLRHHFRQRVSMTPVSYRRAFRRR